MVGLVGLGLNGRKNDVACMLALVFFLSSRIDGDDPTYDDYSAQACRSAPAAGRQTRLIFLSASACFLAADGHACPACIGGARSDRPVRFFNSAPHRLL